MRALPEGPAKARAVREMFDRIAPRYDLVNRVMTFGLDVAWRRRAVAALGLPPGSLVLDLATGTGDLLAEASRSGLLPIGLDSSPGMLANNSKAAPLIRADAAALPIRRGGVAGITCGFAVRNFTDVEPVLRAAHEALRPGGRVSLLEVSTPTSPLLAAGHSIYFGHIVPLIGGLLSDAGAYRYLPRSIAYLPSPEQLAAWLGHAGFTDVRRRLLSGGVAQLVTATKPPLGNSIAP
ncbi:MAG: ubiquinone/menaquinone biosynthesis methyltransferase [Acidimicrobiales bacterium]